MPQGQHLGHGDLRDKTYDGQINEETLLSLGLGQLTDGQIGDGLTNPKELGENYPWIGWRNSTVGKFAYFKNLHSFVFDSHWLFSDAKLQIIFTFEALRNFSAINLHVNNLFRRQIKVFAEAQIFFSSNGLDYNNSKPVTFQYVPNDYLGRLKLKSARFDKR